MLPPFFFAPFASFAVKTVRSAQSLSTSMPPSTMMTGPVE